MAVTPTLDELLDKLADNDAVLARRQQTLHLAREDVNAALEENTSLRVRIQHEIDEQVLRRRQAKQNEGR